MPTHLQNKNYPEKLYITRKKAKFRKVENEQEVIETLTQKGFNVIDFDDLSFWEQVAHMQHAKEFVSIHGAGFSNIIWIKEGAKIKELINQAYAKLEYTFPFWKQAHVCGHTYKPIFGKPVNETTLLINSQTKAQSQDLLVNQNIRVDIIEINS